ncbi:two-component system regulatory protein YycI [Gorillibacterium massiliense]|uniref:two-component system regulatory protein YycI n=1 Tax=Gorillibacterium massiliense TaxID=1280390 RepID=UPI0004B1CBDC|nr:two-component system regulatory protein YycI [Gorillibacterium massiliense]
MDWGRAKTVLILSFLLLNALLGYQLFINRDQAGGQSDAARVKEDTLKLLEVKQIQLKVESIPKQTPKLRAFYYKEVLNAQEPVELSEPIGSGTLIGRNVLKAEMEKAGIVNYDRYRIDASTSKPGMKVYDQLHDDLPIFDVSLVLLEDNNKITGYKQTYVEVQSGGESKEQKVISAYTALRSVAENSLKNDSVVTDIRLGYHGQRFESDTQYMLPSWRIVLASGEIFYVQAFSGAVEKPAESPSATPAVVVPTSAP